MDQTPPPLVPAEVFLARAAAAITDRDYAAYQALLDETALIADVHRRYEARRTLLEVALGAPADGHPDPPACYIAAARAGLQLLAATPSEPVLLDYTAVALYKLGSGLAALELFKASVRLDPNVARVDANLRAAAQRTSDRPVSDAAAAALAELQPQALAVAAQAGPAHGTKVSLCMIVRDEEDMLADCLQSVQGAVDEIVVVDTGSVDATVEIAKSFGARVLHHPWTGNFGEARNVGLDAATGDWLLILDADEQLVAGDAPRLRELCTHSWREAFFLLETHHTGSLEDGTAAQHDAARLFRNRPEYRYSGLVHEQIAMTIPFYLPERIEHTGVRIDHYGYLSTVRDAKDKGRRNLELLEAEARNGERGAFHCFNLGSEYLAIGSHEQALANFREAWAEIMAAPDRQTFAFIPQLGGRLVKTLRLAGHHAEAVTTGDDVLALFPGFTNVLLEQALAVHAGGDTGRAISMLRLCLQWGDAPSRYTPQVGAGTFTALTNLALLLRERGDTQEAEEVLVQCLTDHPRFLSAVEPLASIMLARGAHPGEVATRIKALLGKTGPAAHFQLAVALADAGHAEPAEAELRSVLAGQPGAHAARVALAQTLLAQGRLAEALQCVGEVPGDTAVSGRARATEVFGLLAQGTTDGVQDALAGAAQGALPAGELAALQAWAGRAGDGAPPRLGADAAPSLLAMLDALAGLQAFDAFEQLAAVFDNVDLPWRERRERMAWVYLRRGFVQSAADEWLAVCEREGPDARAYTGLSLVARARGMDADADALAAEAATVGA